MEIQMKLKKSVSIMLSMVMAIGLLMFSPIEAQAAVQIPQSAILSRLDAMVGSSYAQGACLNFVNTFWSSFGVKSAGIHCAWEEGTQYVTNKSTNFTTIPVGANVYYSGTEKQQSTSQGHKAGHVGISIGNGWMVHASGGKVLKSTISSFNGGTLAYMGWGFDPKINVINDVSAPVPGTQITWPLDGSSAVIPNPLSIAWISVSGAKDYWISLRENPSKTNDSAGTLLLDKWCVGNKTSWDVDFDLKPNTYYKIAVQALSVANDKGSWIGSPSIVWFYTGNTINLPTVETLQVTTPLTPDGYFNWANVTLNGGADITIVGIELNKSNNFNDPDVILFTPHDKGQYSSQIVGLDYGATYFYRAMAGNWKGVSYGAVKSFTVSGVKTDTPASDGTVSDVKTDTSVGGVTVYVNGSKVDFDVQPIIDNGRVLIPARYVFEKLGYEVTWDDASQSVTVANNRQTLQMNIGSTVMRHNGVTAAQTFDVPPKIVDGRTLIPLRYAAEVMGYDVKWDDANKRVDVTG